MIQTNGSAAMAPVQPRWDRSHTIGMASAKCAQCGGDGLRGGVDGEPCACVFRGIFRACYERFGNSWSPDFIGRITLDRTSGGKDAGHRFGRPTEEFAADFCLVSRRLLIGRPDEYAIFRLHFLLGGDWRACCKRLGISRGDFFHTVYRLEARLGRGFAELRPYALFPVDEYFGAIRRSRDPV